MAVFFVTQYYSSLSSFVPNFRILTQVVAEKSLTEKKLTDRQTNKQIDKHNYRLEDLKVLRRSPDLLNNVVIGQGKLQLIMDQILFYHIWGGGGGGKRLKQSNE